MTYFVQFFHLLTNSTSGMGVLFVVINKNARMDVTTFKKTLLLKSLI